MPQPIFIISGVPGAGKTTVAIRLVQRFPFGLHIPVDDLRLWVVSGHAAPVPTWAEEMGRQFRLSRHSAALTARLYTDKGFAAAIDDVIPPHDYPSDYAPHLESYQVHKILLLPDLETTLQRNLERTNKDFDTGILTKTIRGLYSELQAEAKNLTDWLVVDSSAMNDIETVDFILSACK